MSEIKTMRLPVKLTEDEVAAKAQDMARAISEINIARVDLSIIQRSMKDDIAAIDKRINELMANVMDKIEYREVEVRELRNNKSLTVETIRVDTVETVATRPMTDSERQLIMFPEPELRVVEPDPFTTQEAAEMSADPEEESHEERGEA